MFFGGHNRKFGERNFAHKSEHDKCVLQRNSGKILQHSLKEQEKGIGRI